jgi:hypothetical protein
MSAGDVRHKDVPATAPGDFYARAAELVAACTVNISHTIPYLANRSIDGKMVYIDREVPEKVAGLASAETLPWHELAEWSAMNDGMDYETAHHTVANPVERQRVEELGGDWTTYEDAYGPLIKEVGDEKIDDVPADLDLRPYEDEDDRKTMAELAAAGDDNARGSRGSQMPAIEGQRFMRLATAAPVSVRAEGDRTIEHILSDESVARDNHTISTAGWRLDNFRKNPVYLWSHDTSAPPIGRFLEIGPVGSQLRGTVKYAERDEYPFADTVFRLTKGGFINASSVSWLPIKWAYAADRSRPGGIDFSEQELLEASAVPVPALASALVGARAAGIDTQPIFDWATRALDLGGFATLPRRELETLRKEAKMAVKHRAKSDPPPDPAPMPIVEPPAVVEPPAAAPAMTKRGLWTVGWLAMLLDDLGMIQASAEWEAASEQDGSTVPADLLAAMKALGETLIKMTVEEVTELLAGDDEDSAAPGDVMAFASKLELKRSAFRALRRLGEGPLMAVDHAMRLQLNGRSVAFTTGTGPVEPLARAGRVLSADNERCLRDAHDHMETARGMVRSVIDQNVDADPEDDGDEDDARALRARQAEAIRIKTTL